MPRLIYSTAALGDLARLRAFLTERNPDAASRAAAAIRQGLRSLQDFPQLGRPSGDQGPEFRAWPIVFGVIGYVVTYRIVGGRIVVLRIRHGREASPDPPP